MEEARRNILGGETAIWTEQTDGGNILSKVRGAKTPHSAEFPCCLDGAEDSGFRSEFVAGGQCGWVERGSPGDDSAQGETGQQGRPG